MEITEAVANLSEVVRALVYDGVNEKKDYGVWAKGNIGFLNYKFDYDPLPGMPSITSLVRPFFHPSVPLVGLNYTQSAHNLLHNFTNGWTLPIRLCRGIVFDHTGKLVALPYPKFFNYGEHPETINLPDGSWEATIKHDGHLGIIFKYGGKIRITTRGDFMSRTAQIARYMLAQHVRSKKWAKKFPDNTTLLVEIIHPETSVYVDYAGRKQFVITGAYDNFSYYDYKYDYKHNDLVDIAKGLSLSVTETWKGNDLDQLIEHMKDTSVQNQEGYVVKFANGLRMKLKYKTYIGKMVADKLSYAYLMRRFMSGNLKKMLETLPEEIYDTALRMLGEITLSHSISGTPQEKWRNLYLLEPEENRTDSFKDTCRKFIQTV